MLHTSTGKPTKEEQRRFRAIKETGCICCRLRGFPEVPPEIHHLTSGNKRIGHTATIGLCPWHHRGVPEDGWKAADMMTMLGPSYALTKRHFREEFGDDEWLLQCQNRILEAYFDLSAVSAP